MKRNGGFSILIIIITVVLLLAFIIVILRDSTFIKINDDSNTSNLSNTDGEIYFNEAESQLTSAGDSSILVTLAGSYPDQLIIFDIDANDFKKIPIDNLRESGSLWFGGVAFSEDKNSIYFLKENDIWEINSDGTNLRNITNYHSGEDKNSRGITISRPRNTINGKYIYYYINKDELYDNTDSVMKPSNIDLGLWFFDTKEHVQKFSGLNPNLVIRGWLPDEKTIIYNNIIYNETTNTVAETKLYDIESNTSTSVDLKVDYILWSKNGKIGLVSSSPNSSRVIKVDEKLNSLEEYDLTVSGGSSKGAWYPKTISSGGEYAVLFNRNEAAYYLLNLETKQVSKLLIKIVSKNIVYNAGSAVYFIPNTYELIYLRPLESSVYKGSLYIYDIESKKSIKIDIGEEYDRFNPNEVFF